ncbi:hypothetical protein AB0O31_09590 [Kitasatospora cineracea]|uniref:hypothetical protein n=1 Tax=Kitasatospora cineracea TaxID=88074 RepID=UPI00343C4BD3
MATQAAATGDTSPTYDLLALDSDGPGTLADLLGGSVTLSVAARAHCPATLIPEQPTAPEFPTYTPELSTPTNPSPAAVPAQIVVGIAGESSLPDVEFTLAKAARSGECGQCTAGS